MPLPEFRIRPTCTGDPGEPNGVALDLTLTWTDDTPPTYSVVIMVATANLEVNSGVLTNPNPNVSVSWTPIECVDNGNDLGFILVNQQTNMVLIAPQDNKSVQVKPLDELTKSDRAFWKFIGSGDAGGAIQLQANTDMNLNVFGNGPYGDDSTVGVWNWGHSQPNEMWHFYPVVGSRFLNPPN